MNFMLNKSNKKAGLFVILIRLQTKLTGYNTKKYGLAYQISFNLIKNVPF